MANLTVEKLFKERKEVLDLSLLAGEEGINRPILTNEVFRPGLALAGNTDRFAFKRVQVLGQTELAFLSSLNPEARVASIKTITSFPIPMVITTKGIMPPAELLEIADQKKITLLSTRLSTSELIRRLSFFLDNVFAPTITKHGTLVDVYGVGLLYTGKSGIGKSECALDLVERGHRLVADDIVRITRKSENTIMGSGDELLGHHMEVRGIGIIDIEKLFGIRAIRLQKRVEVEVRLTYWDDAESYERLGLEERYTTILGAEIPVITIPISPGKNITVISEVIAMNHMLKVYGESPVLQLSKRLGEKIQRQTITTNYLESDYE
ncbi:MAG: HPr(Ser) kinase/phosphatase [candidate division Zixibacteria bacterium]|nr:HPr(Ser) kinase/phosphatase [candidate division Zixibacteria bacterium]